MLDSIMQQRQSGIHMLWTPRKANLVFILIAVVFIPIGIACLIASQKVTRLDHVQALVHEVVEFVERYDDYCIPSDFRGRQLEFIQNAETNKTCTKVFTVHKKMKKPVFIYYQLHNFFQNHRRYTQSRNDEQLRSGKTQNSVTGCDPEATVQIMGKEQPIIPCGLIAWSLFNDTYKFSRDGNALVVNKTDIAWKSDKEKKFGNDVYPRTFQDEGQQQGGAKLDHEIALNQQEDLMVWMRPSALPTIRKLYGRIDEDLEVNDTIVVVIQNNYNTYSFKGEKKLILSTTTWIGGKNKFIGIAYLTVGGYCLISAVFFGVLDLFYPRAKMAVA